MDTFESLMAAKKLAAQSSLDELIEKHKEYEKEKNDLAFQILYIIIL